MHLIDFQYAKAMLMVAKDKKILDVVYKDIENVILPTLKEDSLSELLHSPIILLSTKLSALKTIFQGKINESLLDLLLLVVNNKRGIFLVKILQSFILQFESMRGIKRCTIITALRLSEAMLGQLKTIAHGMTECKDLIVEHIIDEGIIGGYIVFVDHKQLNCSIKSELNRVGKVFAATY